MGHEIRRESGQLELLAANNIKGLLSCFSFIAPSLAATGFGAIILRSSLIGLRMT
jgi:NADP-dependent 3-hydroxy acid dehydrogenase YdfG